MAHHQQGFLANLYKLQGEEGQKPVLSELPSD